MSSNYWTDRVQKQNETNFERTAAATDKKLAELYKKTANNITKDIEKVLKKLDMPVEEILVNDLYKNNQYYWLLSQMNKHLTELGEEEIKITDKKLLEMYEKTSSLVSNQTGFQVGFEDTAADVTKKIWCPDGKHWSDRVWKNKRQMQQMLEQGLTDCLARGLSKDKLVTEMAAMTQNSRYKAERLVRTELTFIQNEAAADTYEKAGITKYKYISATDSRVSDKCKNINGEIFLFKDKQIGKNFPPLHANCRCTIVPVIEDEEKKKKDRLLGNKSVEANGETFEVIERTKEDEEKITKAFNLYTPHEQALLNNIVKDVEIVNTKNGKSFYNFDDKKIYLSNTADERVAVHEMAHALQDAMNLYTDFHYVKLTRDNFPSKGSLLTTLKYNKDENYYYVENDKFVREYQGRIYSKTATNKAELLEEYFSVGYETYIYEPELLKQKDEALYNFIKERVRKE